MANSRSKPRKKPADPRTQALRIMLSALRDDQQGVFLLLATTPAAARVNVAGQAVSGLAAAIRLAGPETVQAVTEAVQAIAQGDREGAPHG